MDSLIPWGKRIQEIARRTEYINPNLRQTSMSTPLFLILDSVIGTDQHVLSLPVVDLTLFVTQVGCILLCSGMSAEESPTHFMVGDTILRAGVKKKKCHPKTSMARQWME